jgi:hypothetical protein
MGYSVLNQECDIQTDGVGYQDLSAPLTRIMPDNRMKISELALVFLFAAEENPPL